MTNFQLRISIINTPDDLSPLKLRGWLLQQAREIQEMSSEHAHTQIKLYLTKRQRFAFPRKKFDALLHGIVDKFPAIHSIELIDVEKSLTNEEMRVASQMANEELNSLGEGLEAHLARNEGGPVH